ncbi:uncharacterized protein LODBEIA_P40330 [Lodderomyces beijingensis]|uniref:Uncharacterized protein n=1 Tax=Lodderomyces beijingensis TaxID=1775926 RepID=A0ABP0ZNS7_9ASCO
MSIITTWTNIVDRKLHSNKHYTKNMNNNSSSINSKLSSGGGSTTTHDTFEETSAPASTIDAVYDLFDLCLYYLMNLVLMMLIFCDLVIDSINSALYKYEIIVCAIKHQLHNNIN